jgi:hypothetical protein
VLATIERLYAMAIEDFPGSDHFLGRMGWLPELLVKIGSGARLDQPGLAPRTAFAPALNATTIET